MPQIPTHIELFQTYNPGTCSGIARNIRSGAWTLYNNVNDLRRVVERPEACEWRYVGGCLPPLAA